MSYEEHLLDTAGGVKNAIKLFDDENILVTNSDVFWIQENKKDIKNFISSYAANELCKLLLVEKEKATGIINEYGDFSINKGLLTRWEKGDKIFYYTGMQMLNLNIFQNFNDTNISFNELWDFQIKHYSLYGKVMKSRLFHVGDIEGLKKANLAIT